MEGFYIVSRWLVSQTHKLLRIIYEKVPSFHLVTVEQKNTIRHLFMSGTAVFVVSNFVYEIYGKKIIAQDFFLFATKFIYLYQSNIG